MIRCELKSGASDEFDGLVAKLTPTIHMQPGGVVAFSCHRVSGRSNSRIMIELFTDHVAFLEFEQRAEVRSFDADRDSLNAEPPRVDFIEDTVGGEPFFKYR